MNRLAAILPASNVLVNALVQEAIGKTVRSSTGDGLPSLRTPNPFAKRTLSFLTIATARPGVFQSRAVFSM